MITSLGASDVSKITSGQVIVDVVSVVKELMDNALDAGSDKIDVVFHSHGAAAVEVADNGSGVDAADYATLCRKHHTSKLAAYADLATVATLGFRGEAMSSMCAVARVKVATCTAQTFPRGAQLVYAADGTLAQQSAFVAGKKGTTVSVSALFSQMPVRRKNLEKHSRREYARALSVAMAYAVAYTHVRFTVFNVSGATGKKSMVLATEGGRASTAAALVNVYGSNGAHGLVPLELRAAGVDARGHLAMASAPAALAFTLTGVISDPSFGMGRGAADRQFLCVNSRPVTHKRICKAISDVYRAFNATQCPVFVLDLRLDAALVDVNVTPDKRSVLIQCEDVICEVIREELTRFYDGRNNTVPKSQLGVVHMGGAGGRPVKTEAPGPARAMAAKDGSDMGEAKAGTIGTGMNGTWRDEEEDEGEEDEEEDEGEEEEGEEEVEEVVEDRGDQIEAIAESDASDNFDDIDSDHLEEIAKAPAAAPVLVSEGESEGESGGESQGESQLAKASEKPAPASDPASLFVQEDASDHSDELDEPVLSVPPDRFDQPDLSVQLIHPNHSHQPRPSDHPSHPEQLAPDTAHARHANGSRSTAPTSAAKCADSAVHRKRAVLRAALHTAAPVEPPAQRAPQLASVQDITMAMEIRKQDFAEMSVAGQFNSGFIIVAHRERLFIVDQHASDEIYNYERLMRTLTLRAQPLVAARTLELSPIDEMVVLDHREELRHNGFIVEEVAGAPPGARVRLTGVPVSKNVVFDDGDLHELVHKLHAHGGRDARCARPAHDTPARVQAARAVRCTKIDKMIASRACRSSIMIGSALSKATMKAVVAHLATLERPWNCPHGRPTMRHLADVAGGGFSQDYEL